MAERPMNRATFLKVFTCAAWLHAQSPVEKAWNILSTAAQDKRYGKGGKAVQA